MPSCYNFNTFNKINDIDNSAYIDILCSYLFSDLVVKKILPSFALFYGSANGLGEYKYDISEEYDELRVDKCFSDNIGKTFILDMYVSSSEEESEEESEEDKSVSNYSTCSSSNNTSDSSYSDYNNDYIVKLKDIPLQLLFIEKLTGTLEDYLYSDNFKDEVLLSCLYQISFSLYYLQEHFDFTHNDLHINNVMYSETETKYLYYLFNNKYYRVPTYGKIFKIIDFGRSIFTYKNKIYMNNVFSKNSEAWGQYEYPSQVDFLKHNSELNGIKPSYNFDLCRLSMTIIEEINDKDINEELFNLLKHMCTDKNGNNYCDMPDDFSLYINISKDTINSLPKDILNNNIFKCYRVTKKQFPHKSYYKI